MSPRSIALLSLALAVVLGVSIAAASGQLGAGSDGPPTRVKTEQAYRSIRSDMIEERTDLEFLLIHARLNTPAELADQLHELAARSREQARVLSQIEPPSSIASLVVVLHEAVVAQRDTLARVARAAASDGPPAARAAEERLRVQSERIRVARDRLEMSFRVGS